MGKHHRICFGSRDIEVENSYLLAWITGRYFAAPAIIELPYISLLPHSLFRSAPRRTNPVRPRPLSTPLTARAPTRHPSWTLCARWNIGAIWRWRRFCTLSTVCRPPCAKSKKWCSALIQVSERDSRSWVGDFFRSFLPSTTFFFLGRRKEMLCYYER